jgi:exoribonuclease II
MNKENSTKIILGGSLLVGLGLWVKNLLSKKKKIYNMPINKKHKNVFYEIGEWVQNTKDYNPQEKVFIADKE